MQTDKKPQAPPTDPTERPAGDVAADKAKETRIHKFTQNYPTERKDYDAHSDLDQPQKKDRAA